MFELMKKIVQIKSWKLFVYATVLYTLSSFIIYYLEPDNFKNPFIGFWWVMTTVTTVGYGDYSPVTNAGKIFGLFLYLAGIGLVGIIIGKVVDSFSYYRVLKEGGKLSYNGNNHIVVIGWSVKSKKTIDELLLSPDNMDIILIDQMDKTPFKHERFHFISGDPTEPVILNKANVLNAHSVSIFSPDSNYDEASADGKSLLIASAIERYGMKNGKNIYTIVEIVKEKNIQSFKHIKVDEFILSNEVFPYLMAKSISYNGTSQLFMQLLSKKYGDDLWEIQPKKNWSTYRDALEALQDDGANLIANHSDFSIIRKLDEEIPSDARLYVICDEETYQKINVI